MHSPPQPFDSPQSRPTQDGVHEHSRGEPRHVSPIPAHIEPGVQVPPQPSLGASPHARIDAGEHVVAQQPLAPQRSPAGHIVPLAHIGQPALCIGVVPQVSSPAAGQFGQQLPPAHVLPLAHWLPVPHVRQTVPVASC